MAISSRHSVRTAILPLRWNRLIRRLCLVCARTPARSSGSVCNKAAGRALRLDRDPEHPYDPLRGSSEQHLLDQINNDMTTAVYTKDLTVPLTAAGFGPQEEPAAPDRNGRGRSLFVTAVVLGNVRGW